MPRSSPVTRNKVILVNPRICSMRSMRLPLSVLSLGAVLEGRYDYQIIDGNVDANATQTVLEAVAETTALVGLTVMPGPQVVSSIRTTF